MIHNVTAFVQGEIKDIESALQLMKNLQKNSIDAYVKQTGLTEKVIVEMMNKETWMTATEALDKKFITEIIDENDKKPENFAQISNCGYKNIPQTNFLNVKNNIEMNLEQINKATGKNFLNEADAIAYLVELQNENKQLKQTVIDAELAVKNKEIEAIIQKAIDQKQILPAQKELYRKILTDSFDTAKKENSCGKNGRVMLEKINFHLNRRRVIQSMVCPRPAKSP